MKPNRPFCIPTTRRTMIYIDEVPQVPPGALCHSKKRRVLIKRFEKVATVSMLITW